MGMSVRAYLGYGVHLSTDRHYTLPFSVDGAGEEDGDDKPEFHTWVRALAGVTDPGEPYYGTEGYPAWRSSEEGFAQMSAYYEASRIADAICPIKVINVSTGGYDDPCVIIALNSTVSEASWAEPVTPNVMVQVSELDAATAFCAEHGIPFDNPQWLLVAEYDH